MLKYALMILKQPAEKNNKNNLIQAAQNILIDAVKQQNISNNKQHALQVIAEILLDIVQC